MSTRKKPSGRPQDERGAFFYDLRALRARAGVSLTDIAGRTRFSADTLAIVEAGPELPSLPALEAYLRGCDEDLTPWEDRWRRLAAATMVYEDLPEKDAGTSPQAVTEAAVPGHSPARVPPFSRLSAVAAASVAAAVLAVVGLTLLVWIQMSGRHDAARFAQGDGSRTPEAIPAIPALRVSVLPATAKPTSSLAPGRGRRASWLKVAGVGCPPAQGARVSLAAAPAGPGWITGSGGWIGNGCDGSAVWTMDSTGSQTAQSSLTWTFNPAAAVSSCTLAVYVPQQNARGVGDYRIFTGAPASSRDIATVPVSQAANAGQWVTLGTYPVSGNSLEVQVAPAASTLDISALDAVPELAINAQGLGTLRQLGVTDLTPGYGSAIAASAASANCT